MRLIMSADEWKRGRKEHRIRERVKRHGCDEFSVRLLRGMAHLDKIEDYCFMILRVVF